MVPTLNPALGPTSLPPLLAETVMIPAAIVIAMAVASVTVVTVGDGGGGGGGLNRWDGVCRQKLALTSRSKLLSTTTGVTVKAEGHPETLAQRARAAMLPMGPGCSAAPSEAMAAV